MSGSVLLVQLAGQRVALPALEIDSVIDLGKITPVPGAPSHITGITSLRSRALTVIDGAKLLGLDGHDGDANERGVVFNLEGHDYALRVEAVDDVVEALTDPAPVPGGAGEGWSEISDGLVETHVGPAMLIKTDSFIKKLN